MLQGTIYAELGTLPHSVLYTGICLLTFTRNNHNTQLYTGTNELSAFFCVESLLNSWSVAFFHYLLFHLLFTQLYLSFLSSISQSTLYFLYFPCSVCTKVLLRRHTILIVALGIVMRPFAVFATIPTRCFQWPLSKRTIRLFVLLMLREIYLEWLVLESRASVLEVSTWPHMARYVRDEYFSGTN